MEGISTLLVREKSLAPARNYTTLPWLYNTSAIHNTDRAIPTSDYFSFYSPFYVPLRVKPFTLLEICFLSVSFNCGVWGSVMVKALRY
jgi:hypothetical protein